MSRAAWCIRIIAGYLGAGTLYVVISIVRDIHWQWLGRRLCALGLEAYEAFVNSFGMIAFFLGAIVFWPALLHADLSRRAKGKDFSYDKN